MYFPVIKDIKQNMIYKKCLLLLTVSREILKTCKRFSWVSS